MTRRSYSQTPPGKPYCTEWPEWPEWHVQCGHDECDEFCFSVQERHLI